MKPKTALTKEAIKAMLKVTLYAERAMGWVAIAKKSLNQL